MKIPMNYNLLWSQDYGCGPLGAHAYDTEPMVYLLYQLDSGSPKSFVGWVVEETMTIAHDGTSAQNIDTAPGYQSTVYVGKDKHGNFLRECNYFCNDCNRYGPIANIIAHNVGNTLSYGGNCSQQHGNDHLIDFGYVVPSKWTNTIRKLSTKLQSCFPSQ